MQDRIWQVDETLLQRAAGPYIRVKLRRTQCEQMFSGLPLKADIARCSRHVSKVPIPEVGGVSFDHLIGAAEQRGRKTQSNRSGRLEVDP